MGALTVDRTEGYSANDTIVIIFLTLIIYFMFCGIYPICSAKIFDLYENRFTLLLSAIPGIIGALLLKKFIKKEEVPFAKYIGTNNEIKWLIIFAILIFLFIVVIAIVPQLFR